MDLSRFEAYYLYIHAKTFLFLGQVENFFPFGFRLSCPQTYRFWRRVSFERSRKLVQLGVFANYNEWNSAYSQNTENETVCVQGIRVLKPHIRENT